LPGSIYVEGRGARCGTVTGGAICREACDAATMASGATIKPGVGPASIGQSPAAVEHGGSLHLRW
jgi:hypothetical protein